MAKESRAPNTNKQSGGVTIGDVIGGIRNSIIAGRDVIFPGSTAEQRAQRNRRAMLELVKNTWIKGVLEQSLHGAAMIELGMEERADAVEHPWDMVLQAPDRPNRALPRGTKIADVFDDMNRALLILGEPGSGKTTMLLELARDTIARAEEDLTLPIPVAFNLSSWAEKRQPIVEWLVEELNIKYYIPKRIARPWVDNDDLLLLLDGLDELKLEYREACVKKINTFRQEHGLTSLVVCSRIADYEALTTRLKLQGAVLLQPLTPQQVDEYLEGAGIELLAVHRTLKHDPTLQESAQSPLMLSVMTLAYQGMSVEDLGSLDSIEARRKHVSDAYVQRMFERRGTDQPYSPEQTIHWLAWLAQKMSEHAQSIFLIERMQPIWLQASAQQRHTILSILIGVLLLVPCFGLYYSRYGLVAGLVVGLGAGLVAGLIGGLLSVPPSVSHRQRPQTFLDLWGERLRGLSVEMISKPASIEPVEVLKWSWTEGGKGLIGGLSFGLIVGLPIGGLLGGLIERTFFDPLVGVLLGLFTGLNTGLISGLIGGLSSTEIETRMVPNQGIRHSARNVVIVWLVGGLSIWLIGGLSSGLTGVLAGVLAGVLRIGLSGLLRLGLNTGLIGLEIGLAFGLTMALFLGLIFGGFACIQHFTLRFMLCLNGHIPSNYARFLDYAAERIFLRKVGGGYIFIHRLLQDYFASLYQEQ